MKNLTQNYNKIKLQILKMKIKRNSYMQSKVYYQILYNFIGFEVEFCCPDSKLEQNNFKNYTHQPSSNNIKLFNKYPFGVSKKDYKIWISQYK
jgi:hypothetical protein